MSQISQELDILINVSSQGLEALSDSDAALKKLVDAQNNLDAARGNSQGVLDRLSGLEQRFQQVLADGARKTLELTNIEAALVRTRQDRVTQDVQLALGSAKLLTVTGDYAGAVTKLEAASKIANATDAQRAQILERLYIAQAKVASAGGGGSGFGNVSGELTTATGGFNALWGAITGVGTAISTVAGYMRSFLLIFYGIKTVIGLVDSFASAILGPFFQVGLEVLNVTTQFRQLDASLLGVVGSARAVKSLTTDIASASAGLPLTQLQALSTVRSVAYNPAVASGLGTAGPERDQLLRNLERVVAGFASINPEQGVEGAQSSLRQALAGEFRTLRTRFGVSPDVVAATVGKSQAELKADPSLILTALTKFVDTFVGDDVIDAFNKLLTTQANRLRGGLEEFANLIGDSGIYDRVTGLLRSLADKLTGGIHSGQFNTGANIAGIGLNQGFDALVGAGNRTLSGLTGRAIDLENLQPKDIEALGDAVGKIIAQLGRLAAALIDAVPELAGRLLGLFGTSEETLASDAKAKRGFAENERKVAGQYQLSVKRLTGPNPYSDPGPGESHLGSFTSVKQYQDEIDKLTIAAAANDRSANGIESILALLHPASLAPVPPATAQQLADRAGRASIGDLRDTGSELNRRLLIASTGGARGRGSASSLGGEGGDFVDQSVENVDNRLESVFGANGANSITTLLKAADTRLAELQTRVGALLDYVGPESPSLVQEELTTAIQEIRRGQDAKAASIVTATHTLNDAIAGTIEQAAKDLKKAKGPSAIQQGSDVLDAVLNQLGAGSLGTSFRGIVGAPELGQPGGTAANLASLFGFGSASGLDTSGAIKPDVLKSVADIINDIGKDVLSTTGDIDKARSVVDSASKAFEAFTQAKISGGKLDPAARDSYLQTIDLLTQLRIEWLKTYETIKDKEIAKLEKEAAAAAEDTIKRDADGSKRRLDAAGASVNFSDLTIRAGERGQLAALRTEPRGLATQSIDVAQAGLNSGIDAITNPSDPRSVPFLLSTIDQSIALISAKLLEANSALDEAKRNAAGLDDAQLARDTRLLEEGVTKLDEDLGKEFDKRTQIVDNANKNLRLSFGRFLDKAPGQIQNSPGSQVYDLLSPGVTPRTEAARSTIDQILNVSKTQDPKLKGAGLDTLGANPDDVQRIIGLLGEYKKSLEDAGVSTDDTRKEVGALADTFANQFKDAVEAAPPELKNAFESAYQQVHSFREKLVTEFQTIHDAVVSVAGGISDAWKTGVTDALVDLTKTGGANIASIFQTLGTTVETYIFKEIVDITLIRSFLNPLINSAFGLSGTGALPTFNIGSLFGSRVGHVFDGGAPIGFAAGGTFHQTPTTFGMAGGRTGVIAEEQPEVSFPVVRRGDGRMGILMDRGGGGGGPTNINFAIYANNPSEFNNSGRQIGDSMRRAWQRASGRA